MMTERDGLDGVLDGQLDGKPVEEREGRAGGREVLGAVLGGGKCEPVPVGGKLVLTRRVEEAVILIMPDGTKMRIAVVQVKGDRVRIAFDGPTTISIAREEVYLAGFLNGERKPAAAG